MDACLNSGHHKTIPIEYEDQHAEVDEKIAPLILLMWKNGIKTAFSCQDYGESNGCDCHKGFYTIQFRGDEELNKFLDMIQVPTRELGLPEATVHPFPMFVWEFETYPVWVAKSLMMHTILFPSTYADYLTRRLTRRLEDPNTDSGANHEEIESIERALYHRDVLPPVQG
jgi:hypothetical protein